MKEIVRSFSNRDNRTHWWNLTSSISIALPLDAVDKTPSTDEKRIEEYLTHFVLYFQTSLCHSDQVGARASQRGSISSSPPQEFRTGQRCRWRLPDRKLGHMRKPAVGGEKRTRRFTLSITSKKTSFLRYRIPSDRQDTAFVTAIGGRT